MSFCLSSMTRKSSYLATLGYLLKASRGAALVDVAQRDDVLAGDIAEIAAPLAAGADDGDVEPIHRIVLPGRPRLGHVGDGEIADARGGARLHEAPAIDLPTHGVLLIMLERKKGTGPRVFFVEYVGISVSGLPAGCNQNVGPRDLRPACRAGR